MFTLEAIHAQGYRWDTIRTETTYGDFFLVTLYDADGEEVGSCTTEDSIGAIESVIEMYEEHIFQQ